MNMIELQSCETNIMGYYERSNILESFSLSSNLLRTARESPLFSNLPMHVRKPFFTVSMNLELPRHIDIIVLPLHIYTIFSVSSDLSRCAKYVVRAAGCECKTLVAIK